MLKTEVQPIFEPTAQKKRNVVIPLRNATLLLRNGSEASYETEVTS